MILSSAALTLPVQYRWVHLLEEDAVTNDKGLVGATRWQAAEGFFDVDLRRPIASVVLGACH